MEFSRKEYWSGLLFPSPGDLPSPHIKPGLPKLQADSFLSEPPGKPLQNNIPLPKNLQNFYCSYLLHTHQHPSIPPFSLSIFLSTYYAVETALGTGDTAVRKIIQILCPHRTHHLPRTQRSIRVKHKLLCSEGCDREERPYCQSTSKGSFI